MRTPANITGQPFGSLVAIAQTGERYLDGSVMWLCRCKCGQEFEHSVTRLRRGDFARCACQGGRTGRTRSPSRARVIPSAATCSNIQQFLCHHPAPNLEPNLTEAKP